MTLLVTVKSGLRQGATAAFPDTVERIRFGRSLDCEVSFPEEEHSVGHHHFELRREAGGYKFVVNPSYRVFIGGKDAYQDAPLDEPCDVTIGPDGPVVSLQPIRAMADNVIPTKPQGKAITDHARIQILWPYRFIFAGALGVIAVALAGIYLYFSSQIQGIRADANVLLHEIEKSGHGTSFTTQVEQLRPSVFLVGASDSNDSFDALGSAWVVSTKDGRKALATNAHVAAGFDQLPAGTRMVARAPGTGNEIQIVSAELHPAYKPFDDVQKAVKRELDDKSIRQIGMAPGFDVALLFVAAPEALPPPLTLASEAELKLPVGQPLATLGFPLRDVVGSDLQRPIAFLQQGILVGRTNFFLRPDTRHPLLLVNSIPGTGGLSGAPIINTHGHIVGLYNGGNVTNGVPNAAQMNFAQHVDLLKELIEGVAGERVPDYRVTWNATVAAARLPIERVVRERLEGFRREFGANVTTVVEATSKLEKPEPAYDRQLAVEYRFRVEANATYLAVVSSRGDAAFSLYLRDRKSGELLDTAVSRAPVAILEYPSTASTEASVWILSESVLPEGRPDTSPVAYDFKLLSGR